jgi:phosphatidylserine/phosphatidylglycerophosphate/cardiolipin synthase-like enzyme
MDIGAHYINRAEPVAAICKVLTPSKNLKPIPLLHAKAIVADRSTGYMGSANLTGNGMDLSVELGMAFDGPLARQLASWMISLGDALVDWRDQRAPFASQKSTVLLLQLLKSAGAGFGVAFFICGCRP